MPSSLPSAKLATSRQYRIAFLYQRSITSRSGPEHGLGHSFFVRRLLLVRGGCRLLGHGVLGWQLHDGSHFDGAGLGAWAPGGQVDGFSEIFGLDHVEAAEGLLGLSEWSVADEPLALAEATVVAVVVGCRGSPPFMAPLWTR